MDESIPAKYSFYLLNKHGYLTDKNIENFIKASYNFIYRFFKYASMVF